MKNLKRVLLALLAVLLMCAVVGCGGNDPSSPTGKTDDTTGGATRPASVKV